MWGTPKASKRHPTPPSLKKWGHRRGWNTKLLLCPPHYTCSSSVVVVVLYTANPLHKNPLKISMKLCHPMVYSH